MRLTHFTDYALRVLLFVGKERDRVCTMGEISDYYDISLEHLRKVVHRMAKLGYLKSSRGRGGGIVLGHDPVKIRIGNFIIAMEEDLSIVDCQAMACRLLPDCSLKRALAQGSRAFVAEMNKYTLADLLGSRAMRRQFRVIEFAARPR